MAVHELQQYHESFRYISGLRSKALWMTSLYLTTVLLYGNILYDAKHVLIVLCVNWFVVTSRASLAAYHIQYLAVILVVVSKRLAFMAD